MEMITGAAMKCGFTGGLVVDYPNSTKAKKYSCISFLFNLARYFLCLFAGMPVGGYQLPKALGDEEEMDEEASTVSYSK